MAHVLRCLLVWLREDVLLRPVWMERKPPTADCEVYIFMYLVGMTCRLQSCCSRLSTVRTCLRCGQSPLLSDLRPDSRNPCRQSCASRAARRHISVQLSDGMHANPEATYAATEPVGTMSFPGLVAASFPQRCSSHPSTQWRKSREQGTYENDASRRFYHWIKTSRVLASILPVQPIISFLIWMNPLCIEPWSVDIRILIWGFGF